MISFSVERPCELVDLARYLVCFALLLASTEGLVARWRMLRVIGEMKAGELPLPPSVSASSNLAVCVLSLALIGASGLRLDPLEGLTGVALSIVVWRALLTSPLGFDTSDFMLGALLANVTVGSLVASDPARCSRLVWVSALTWLAMYVISGVAKLSKPWLTGSALTTILTATSFGSSGMSATLNRHPLLWRLAQWSVITFEIGAPALLFLTPLPIAYAGLGFAVLLHVGTLVMGLTGFVAAFLAYSPLLAYAIEETH